MCGRFCVDQNIPIEELKAIIEEVDRKLKEMTQTDTEQLKMPLGEIFPTNIVPAIIGNRLNQTSASPMRWGFSKYSGPGVIINARSETVLEKPMFRLPVLERRCLIPATNYYEWGKSVEKIKQESFTDIILNDSYAHNNVNPTKDNSKKIKYAIKDPSSQLIYMAGIYRYEADKQLPVFTILTRDAAKGIRYIHDRMPVILSREAQMAWLSDTTDITGVISAAIEDVIAEAV